MSRRQVMASMMAPGALSAVPPELLAFAAGQGVLAYLPAVLEMTRRIFPASPVRGVVEEDAEVENDRHIVFEVEVGGREVAELVAAQSRWSSEIFQHCP